MVMNRRVELQQETLIEVLDGFIRIPMRARADVCVNETREELFFCFGDLLPKGAQVIQGLHNCLIRGMFMEKVEASLC